MSGNKKNIAASVRQRLLNKARTDKRPFNELLQYFAMERFLFRLSCSPHAEKFILKGALMLWVWQAPISRATMDIDMLARQTSNEVERIVDQVKDICSISAQEDGLQFDLSTIRGERITEDADYEGVRVRFIVWLDRAKVNMQIDIGFGDIVIPGPTEAKLPTLLDFESPKLMCYSPESAIAEKFEAMIKLGELNSRMKDFYDIWLLSRQFNFDSSMLQSAIVQTMDNRGTVLPVEVSAFSNDFIHAKLIQWKAFRNKLRQEGIPDDLGDIMNQIKMFLEPIVDAIHSRTDLFSSWRAPGPWR